MTYNECKSLLCDFINNASADKPFVIAIDGRSASGKTTFAEEISRLTGVPVIHTDDFCRPRDKQGKVNVSSFDGNFDIQRFRDEVVESFKQNKEFVICLFNCQKGCIDNRVTVPKSNCYIVEGAYSHNPNLGEYASLKIFFNTTVEKQTERILKRNGELALEKYLSVWIPAEERYFKHYEVLEKSKYIINN